MSEGIVLLGEPMRSVTNKKGDLVERQENTKINGFVYSIVWSRPGTRGADPISTLRFSTIARD